MPLLNLAICDGCKMRKEIPKVFALPEKWAKIGGELGGSIDFSVDLILCPKCAEKVGKAIQKALNLRHGR